MLISPLHLSYSVRHGDGGIAFAVDDLVASQQSRGLYARWLSADRYSPWHRDRRFAEAVIESGATVLHCHGLWRTQTRAARRYMSEQLPLLVAPHGMMDDWAMAHSSWKKELVWRLWEGNALKSAVCLHALCIAEARSIRRRLPNVPIAVIPNGVSPAPQQIHPRQLVPWFKDIPAGEKILLFLGRFHQKKGLEPLMTAWQSVIDDARMSGWWLVCVGFGDEGKFESQLRSFPVERCRAYGPVFGEKKAATFQHASAFILPSYSEGLPMAALEAMSHGLPCLLSSACNLPEAFSAGAARPAEPETARLIQSLRLFFADGDPARKIMGAKGRQLTAERFHWDHIAHMTHDVYRWVLGDGPKPPCVQTSGGYQSW